MTPEDKEVLVRLVAEAQHTTVDAILEDLSTYPSPGLELDLLAGRAFRSLSEIPITRRAFARIHRPSE